jgi:uncharacterized membrane protein YidH (DUF202 family)
MNDPTQASERTALAWNRTGLSFVVVGAVVLRVFPPFDEPFKGAVGVAMVLTGVVAATFAWRPRTRPEAERAVRRLAVATTTLALATALTALAA